MIKEIIVVEGKDDISAVKAAVDAEVISTHGYGYGMKFINKLREMSKRRGIIIFTDPDYMGKKIRSDISDKIPGCKHAFLPQGKALKKGNIGVENASVEDIREALMGARCVVVERNDEFSKADLIKYGLTGAVNSAEKREKLSDKLGIGNGNAKQLLNKLNHFGITREEFERVLRSIEDEE